MLVKLVKLVKVSNFGAIGNSSDKDLSQQINHCHKISCTIVYLILLQCSVEEAEELQHSLL